MGLLIQKYGGSSVADHHCILEVTEIIAKTVAQGHKLVVVVSAMGKTTDNLLQQASLLNSDPPRRELDMLVTTGERITMALLCMALEAKGIAAMSLTGSQSGIITDNRHQGARIVEVRPWRIRRGLDNDRVVVVAGYQGVSLTGEITTLGRGGSDTTAVALACALRADRCEIYSDVDGIYSADPKIVVDAQHLPQISYDNMIDMARVGAKVLASEAILLAMAEKIQVLAKKTANAEGAFSHIYQDNWYPKNNPVQAVIGSPHISILSGDFHNATSNNQHWQTQKMIMQDLLASGAKLVWANQQAWIIDRTGIIQQNIQPIEHLAQHYRLKAEHCSMVSLIGQGLLYGFLEPLPTLMEKFQSQIHCLLLHERQLSFQVAKEQLPDIVRYLHQHCVSQPLAWHQGL